MRTKKTTLCFVLSFFLTFTFVLAQNESALYKRLKSFKEISSITPLKVDTSFAEGYALMITQRVDHNNPNSPTFKQKVYLLHRGGSVHTVLALEGYAAGFNRVYELTRILMANQILVEHRYFGKSVPDNFDWKYLTVKQSADDHHVVVELFKKIYTGKWISTGISKGGQTTVFFKRFYPNDVDVAVPYVAPINSSMEDPRLNEFLRKVGTEECRKKILDYQRAFLKRKDEILPLMMKDAEASNTRFPFDWEVIYELWTLEYSFTFWQYGATTCEEIPNADADAKILFEHMRKVNGFDFFSEAGMKQYGPSYYQFYKEIGYYNYDLEPFKDLLTEVKNGSNIIWVPKVANVKFDDRLLKDVNEWLKKNSNNMIFIYGELDAWSGTAVNLSGETNALKMVRKDGHHVTNIKSFDPESREKILSTLEKWLEISIKRDFK